MAATDVIIRSLDEVSCILEHPCEHKCQPAFELPSQEASRQVSSADRRFVPEGGVDASLPAGHFRVHELHHLVTDSAGFVVEDHGGQRFTHLVRNEVGDLKANC